MNSCGDKYVFLVRESSQKYLKLIKIGRKKNKINDIFYFTGVEHSEKGI